MREVLPEGGSADPGLSDIGALQAEAAADFMEHEGIHHIASSSMRRAMETAEPLAKRLGLSVESLDDLRESDHRSNVYVPLEEMDPDDPATAHYWEGDPRASLFPDGEDEFRARVLRGFEHVIGSNRSRTVAVFCHAMVTSVYLQCLLGMDNPLSVLVDYCGITRVAAASNGYRTVRSVNETHHVRGLIGR